ncbi:MAG: hypothetical protein K0U41_03690 [Gammaproteobacteria bacterium]|nr:hypothetical protein [Gammaproteobacteria bacterium]
MDLSNARARGIAKLKNCEKVEDIADELEVSSSIVREWAEELTPSEMTGRESNALAINKAVKMLREGQIDMDELEDKIGSVALKIIKEVESGMGDYEIAKALNVSANTVKMLQETFFGKPELHLHKHEMSSGMSGEGVSAFAASNKS